MYTYFLLRLRDGYKPLCACIYDCFSRAVIYEIFNAEVKLHFQSYKDKYYAAFL
jgi:hypothetical protein